jgi:hypothetical protein
MPRNSLYRDVYEQRQSAKSPSGDNSHIEIETPQIVPPHRRTHPAIQFNPPDMKQKPLKGHHG